MTQLPDNASQTQTQLGQINELLEGGTIRQVRRTILALAPAEVAHLLASSPPASRNILWELVDKKNAGEVLEELPVEVQSQFLQRMTTQDVVAITQGLDADDVVDILQALPDQVTVEVIHAMSPSDRQRIALILPYAEDTAGGLTNPDTITVRPKLSLHVVLRYLRRHRALPPATDSLYVVNKNDEYLGTLSIAKIVTTDPSLRVEQVMVSDVKPIPASLSEQDVANLFEKHDWVSAPVVNENGKLLGRITIDDVVDVIRDNADHALMSFAGLDEESDTFATVWRTTPRRAIWLGINLLTAILASSVINIFQDTIDKVVALAVLMPIVASMGGVAGSQTLTVVIRGMALGQIGRSNVSWLLSREFFVGIINGGIWSAAVAAVAGWWFNDPTIALIIACAMIINLVTASLAGVLIPMALKTLRIDPALAGGVTLTTVTDVVGFLAFLGLATFFYA